MSVMILLIAIALVLITYNFIKNHNEEMRQINSKRSLAPKKVSTENINVRIMDLVHSLSDSNKVHYWDGFKRRKPSDARAIESLTRVNMDALSDKDAFEIVSSFLRWSENAGKPISQLKESTMSHAEFLNEIQYETLISRFKQEARKEAATFNISPNHTISHYMLTFIKEAYKNQQRVSFALTSLRKLIEDLLNTIITSSMKAKMNEDMAYIFGSLVVDMIKSGDIDSRLKVLLPAATISNISMMHELYVSGKVDAAEFDEILEDSLYKFIKQF